MVIECIQFSFMDLWLGAYAVLENISINCKAVMEGEKLLLELMDVTQSQFGGYLSHIAGHHA